MLKEQHLAGSGKLIEFAMGHYYYGLHRDNDGWVFREWAPNADNIFLIGIFSDWKEKPSYNLNRINEYGDWEIKLPPESLNHGDLYKLSMHWKGGKGERIPSYATRLVQDENTKIFTTQVWNPEKPYKWKVKNFKGRDYCPGDL